MPAKAPNSNRPKAINWLLVLSTLIFPLAVVAQDEVKMPDEVKRFVEKDRIPIALETGDLNNDGRKDYILVISDVVNADAPYEEGAGERSVLILVREANGSFTMAGRNDLVAMCKNCGGAFGDPFAGIAIRGTRFTVSNYGGSNSRWAYDYTFNYSRRDKTWQLVRVEETNFHALDPKRTEKRHIYIPPKDFGLITFADFDPDTFRGKGKK